MEQEKSFTQQCSVKPVCHPQGCPSETSLREEASGFALSTSPASLSRFPHSPKASTSSWCSHSPLHACPHLRL